jgi:hypothetical protein
MAAAVAVEILLAVTVVLLMDAAVVVPVALAVTVALLTGAAVVVAHSTSSNSSSN